MLRRLWSCVRLNLLLLLMGSDARLNGAQEYGSLGRSQPAGEPQHHVTSLEQHMANKPPRNVSPQDYGRLMNQEINTGDLSSLERQDKVTFTDGDIEMIYASTKTCMVKELEVRVPVLIDKSVKENCPDLAIITMTGGGWNCTWDGWDWLKTWHEEENHINNQPDLTCARNENTDVTSCNNTRGDFSTGLHYQKYCLEGLSGCRPCKCIFNYVSKLKEFLAMINCTGRNLTDDTIPTHLPLQTNNLMMRNNSLRTGSSLMILAAKMPFLSFINFDGNQLTQVPAIRDEHISNLSRIILCRNNIENLMVPEFESYLRRSDHLKVQIEGNPLHCGCEFYKILLWMKEEGIKTSMINFLPDFLRIQCRSGGSFPKLYPDSSCPELLESTSNASMNLLLVVLCLINVVFAGLVFDLHRAICQLKRGYSQPRIPYFHVIYLACTTFFQRCNLFWIDSNRGPKPAAVDNNHAKGELETRLDRETSC